MLHNMTRHDICVHVSDEHGSEVVKVFPKSGQIISLLFSNARNHGHACGVPVRSAKYVSNIISVPNIPECEGIIVPRVVAEFLRVHGHPAIVGIPVYAPDTDPFNVVRDSSNIIVGCRGLVRYDLPANIETKKSA